VAAVDEPDVDEEGFLRKCREADFTRLPFVAPSDLGEGSICLRRGREEEKSHSAQTDWSVAGGIDAADDMGWWKGGCPWWSNSLRNEASESAMEYSDSVSAAAAASYAVSVLPLP
jgi:hypothetical protein